MRAQKVTSSSGHAAGRDVNTEVGLENGIAAVHGGTNLVSSGVTVVINQGQGKVEQSVPTPSLFDVVSGVCGLEEREKKSFLRFARSAFEQTPLDDVDGRSMKRLHAYLVAIYKGRGPGAT